MAKITGNINGKQYFNEKFILVLSKAVDSKIQNEGVEIIEIQTPNLIDIFERKSDDFLSYVGAKDFLIKLDEFLISNYQFDNAHKLIELVQKLITEKKLRE